MRIDGLNHTTLYPIKNEEVQHSAIAKPQELLSRDAKAAESTKEKVAEGFASVRAPKTAELENISLTFNKGDTFDYLGKEKQIESLDVQRAVQDAQKDEILQQYHYFVGSPDIGVEIFKSEDGTVIAK